MIKTVVRDPLFLAQKSVNFFGIHYMPTLVVFAGMLPMCLDITQNFAYNVCLVGLC